MSEHARRELEPHPAALPLRLGASGTIVKRIQEWLCLHGFHVAVDEDFGPATEAALDAFQRNMVEEDVLGREEWITGVVDDRTWAALTEPLRRVVEWERDPPLSPGAEIVACANAHLGSHPREVGKPNGGLWVRYYCRGQEVPWCAGFATTVLGQALGHDEWYTLSCDELAANAMAIGRFRRGDDGNRPRPGDMFLIRTPGLSMVDWIHTGIVTAVGPDYFETVEGNTNLDGSREGTAVHARTRAFKPNVDFVLTGWESR